MVISANFFMTSGFLFIAYKNGANAVKAALMVSPTPMTVVSRVKVVVAVEEVEVVTAPLIRSIPPTPTLDVRIGAPRMEAPVPDVNSEANEVVSYVTYEIWVTVSAESSDRTL